MGNIKTQGIWKGFSLIILRILFSLFSLILAYLILAVILGVIPVNKDFTNTSEGIEIFVGTNGVHTDILMPVKNEFIDWRETIPLKHFSGADYSFKYISMGWGDKGFYINTPKWEDLTAKTALKALFLPSEAAMHVTYVQNVPTESRKYIMLKISEAQYRSLIDFIMPYFKTIDDSIILIPEANYSRYDNFYEAREHYTLFNTSNNWTNRALKYSGIRAAMWSPFDISIMYQARQVGKEEKG